MYKCWCGLPVVLIVATLGMACDPSGGGAPTDGGLGASDTGPGDGGQSRDGGDSDSGTPDGAAPDSGGTGAPDGGADSGGPILIAPTLTMIGTTGQDSRDRARPKVAIDGRGNAVALWPAVQGLMASRYSKASGWQTPERVDSQSQARVFHDVVMNESGLAVAAWGQDVGIWTNMGALGAAWTGPRRLTTETGEAAEFVQEPSVGVDSAGNVLVAYLLHSLVPLRAQYTVWAVRYTPLNGWEAPAMIQGPGGVAVDPMTPPSGPGAGRIASSVRLAMNGAGHAVATWYQYVAVGSLTSEVWANYFAPGVGWGVASALGEGRDPEVTVDGAGDALVAWTLDTQTTSLMSRRYTPSGGWSAAVPVVAGEPSVFAHQLRGDLAGNAHLVWNRTDDVLSEDSFWWSRFSPGSGWTAPEQLLRLGLNWFDEYGATLAVSPGGAAMLTWNSWNAGRLVRRFDLTKGWAALERVPSDDERPSYGPAALALDASGNATIVCELRSSGPTEIWAVQF